MSCIQSYHCRYYEFPKSLCSRPPLVRRAHTLKIYLPYIHTYIYTLDCNIFVGIKANIQRFYNSVPAARIDKQPAERVRMYGLLAWFNAVIQERLRYLVQQLRILYTYVYPTHIHLCYVDTRRLVSPRSTSSPRRIRMYLWTSSTSGWTM